MVVQINPLWWKCLLSSIAGNGNLNRFELKYIYIYVTRFQEVSGGTIGHVIKQKASFLFSQNIFLTGPWDSQRAKGLPVAAQSQTILGAPYVFPWKWVKWLVLVAYCWVKIQNIKFYLWQGYTYSKIEYTWRVRTRRWYGEMRKVDLILKWNWCQFWFCLSYFSTEAVTRY